MKRNFRSDKILEIVTLSLVFISGSQGRVFWFSSVFDWKSNFFEPHGFSTCTPVQEGRCGQDVYEDQKVTADFQVCGFD